MLRLTTQNRSKISNRLAGFAALMLVISALANTNNDMESDSFNSAQLAAVSTIEMEQPDNIQAITQTSTVRSPNKKSKGFKMSLFLFRN